MKNIGYKLTFVLMIAATIVSCNRGPKSDIEGFKKTDSGLHYNFITQNNDSRQVQKGDMLIGEMLLRLENDTLFSNIGDCGNLMIVNNNRFDGDIIEGLLMMHEGDKAIFAVDADKMAEKLQPDQMPQSFVSNSNMKLYYEIDLKEIKSAEEIKQAQEKFLADMNHMQAEEQTSIETYVNDNAIKETPRENGLYVIMQKKGNGPKVDVGKHIKVAYTGYLTNGKIFDTSNKELATQNGLEPHDAIEFVVGQANLIKGWDEGLKGMPQGSKAKLIIPSKLAYGEKGAGDAIPPYSALVFDVEILSVN